MAKKSIGKLDFSFTDNGLIWRWDNGKTHRMFAKKDNEAEQADDTIESGNGGDRYYEDNVQQYDDGNGGAYYDDQNAQYPDENGEYYDDGNGDGYYDDGNGGYYDDGNGDGYYDDNNGGYYDDGGYQDNNYYDNDGGNGDGYYDPQSDAYYGEDNDSVGSGNAAMDFMLSNDWVMYLALIILPPLGIYLLWKKQKFDISVRSAITAASAIWFILLIWLLFFNKPQDPTIQPGVKQQVSAVTQQPVTPIVTEDTSFNEPGTEGTPEPTPAPTPRVQTGAELGTLTEGEDGDYVWITNTGAYYHNVDTCSAIGNATPSRVELSVATARAKSACPTCFEQQVAGASYYATDSGKYYHTKANCSGMSGASPITEAAALAAGKAPCPECLGYYCTPGGKYIHNKPNCSDMTGAQLVTKSEIAKMGNKDWCPICFPTKKSAEQKEDFTYVYATQGGTYYHTKDNCSGMSGASKIKLTTALASGKAACSKCVSNNTLYVFATKNGTYYHIDAKCSGMNGASRVTITAALARGKKACPTCAKLMNTATDKGGKGSKALGQTTLTGGTSKSTGTGKAAGTTTRTDTYTYVYATSQGTYYHTDSTCSGMNGASKVKVGSAINAGKKACPTCVTTGKLYVFATKNGTYYHTDATCSGMKDALRVTMQAAIKNGKSACPTCAKNLISTGSSKKTSNTTTENKNTTKTTKKTTAQTEAKVYKTSAAATSAKQATYVYATKGGKYYHTSNDCSGMKGASLVKLSTAASAGKKACPDCVKASTMRVFATKNGDYYHTDAHCSGMNNASCVTIQQAKNSGKSVCPKCAGGTLSKQTSSYSAPASTKVYLDNSSSKSVYHKNRNCEATGMHGGTAVTLAYALDFGYKACPYCNPASKTSH